MSNSVFAHAAYAIGPACSSSSKAAKFMRIRFDAFIDVMSPAVEAIHAWLHAEADGNELPESLASLAADKSLKDAVTAVSPVVAANLTGILNYVDMSLAKADTETSFTELLWQENGRPAMELLAQAIYARDVLQFKTFVSRHGGRKAVFIRTSDEDSHVDGSQTGADTWLFGFGLYHFPGTVPEEFTEAGACWHTWVSGAV